MTVKYKQEDVLHPHMQTHGPESKWGHAILLQRKHCPPIVIHRVVALTQLPTHSQIDTCTLRETRLARLAHSKIGITHKIHSKHFTVAVISAPCSAHTPSTLPPSYHPVRSRRWFFGRSCRAHCSQASATLYPSPPSLLTPTHTDPSGRAFTPSLAHQLFRLLPGHMHARAHQPSYSHIQYSHTHHTERGKCWCTGSCCWSMSSPLQWSNKEEEEIKLLQYGCLLFHPPLIIQITLQCNRYSVQDVLTLLGERAGRRRRRKPEDFLCCQSLKAIQTSKCDNYLQEKKHKSLLKMGIKQAHKQS